VYALRIYQVLALGCKQDYPLVDMVKSRDLFKFCPNHIFGIGESRHFKFRCCVCMLYFSRKGYVQSCDL